MTFTKEQFDAIKSRGVELYKSFTPVRCPYFNDFVYFNAQGLEHLKFKRRGVQRIPQDQYMRFKLLHLVPIVIRLSRTLQGRSSRNGFEPAHTNGRATWITAHKIYYEFIAILDEVRIRVIVKRVNERLEFWSVIPYWKESVDHERTFDFGNAAED